MPLVDDEAAKRIVVTSFVFGFPHPLRQGEPGYVLAFDYDPLSMNPYPSEVTPVLAGAYTSVDTFIDMGGEAVCDGALEG